MADNMHTRNGGDENEDVDVSKSQTTEDSPPNVHEFVTSQFERQAADVDPEVDNDRRANFFARAVNESQRMNKEVEKSHQRLAKLHNEFGAQMFDSWRAEHSAEVLTPQQREAVETAAANTQQEMMQS